MGEVNNLESFHAIAHKGTLIISDQNGMHRGIPQEKGHERMLLSISYLVPII